MFFRHLGTVMESLAFEMGQEGPANGTVQLVAQGEEKTAATVDAAPDAYPLKRFSQGRGFIRRGGVALAQVTGGNLTFSNNLERVRVIRDDGKIAGADPTIATCTGAMTMRFDGSSLVAEAANGEPVALEYGFTTTDGWSALLRAVPGVPAEAQVRHRRARRCRGQLRLARRLRRDRRHLAAREAAQRRRQLRVISTRDCDTPETGETRQCPTQPARLGCGRFTSKSAARDETPNRRE